MGIEAAIQVGAERDVGFEVDEVQQCFIVWGNIFARIPLSRDLFSGPYDERWGLEKQT